MNITIIDKMLFRLFFLPILIIISGEIASIMFTNQVHLLDKNSIFYPILGQIFWYFVIASLLFSGSGFLWFLINIFHLRTWYLGKSQDICPNCGGMVEYHSGRFGEYMKCLACGKNTKSR